MYDGFIGEIRIFAGNFAPRGWMFCDGYTLDIQQFPELFSVIGDRYGGNGYSNFNLPDFKNRNVKGSGLGPGLPFYQLGQKGGFSNTYIPTSALPSHSHSVITSTETAEFKEATDHFLSKSNARFARNIYRIDENGSSLNKTLSDETISFTGGSQPFYSEAPFLNLNYIICFDGEYPARS